MSFGANSNKNGQIWYGKTTHFPGFLYKKNLGANGSRSTNFAPGGNLTYNTPQNVFNKYTPGQNGIGATTIANRRAKNRYASICSNGKYGFYMSLGL